MQAMHLQQLPPAASFQGPTAMSKPHQELLVPVKKRACIRPSHVEGTQQDGAPGGSRVPRAPARTGSAPQTPDPGRRRTAPWPGAPAQQRARPSAQTAARRGPPAPAGPRGAGSGGRPLRCRLRAHTCGPSSCNILWNCSHCSIMRMECSNKLVHVHPKSTECKACDSESLRRSTGGSLGSQYHLQLSAAWLSPAGRCQKACWMHVGRHSQGAHLCQLCARQDRFEGRMARTAAKRMTTKKELEPPNTNTDVHGGEVRCMPAALSQQMACRPCAQGGRRTRSPRSPASAR